MDAAHQQFCWNWSKNPTLIFPIDSHPLQTIKVIPSRSQLIWIHQFVFSHYIGSCVDWVCSLHSCLFHSSIFSDRHSAVGSCSVAICDKWLGKTSIYWSEYQYLLPQSFPCDSLATIPRAILFFLHCPKKRNKPTWASCNLASCLDLPFVKYPALWNLASIRGDGTIGPVIPRCCDIPLRNFSSQLMELASSLMADIRCRTTYHSSNIVKFHLFSLFGSGPKLCPKSSPWYEEDL